MKAQVKPWEVRARARSLSLQVRTLATRPACLPACKCPHPPSQSGRWLHTWAAGGDCGLPTLRSPCKCTHAVPGLTGKVPAGLLSPSLSCLVQSFCSARREG